MTSRHCLAALSAAGMVFTGWTVAQFLLCRHAVDQLRAFNAAYDREHAAAFSARNIPLLHPSVPDAIWVRAGVESVIFAMLVLGLGGLIAYGGHRWWGLLVAVCPAAALISLSAGTGELGLGWNQFGDPHNDPLPWWRIGAIADTGLVLLVLGAVIAVMKRRDALTSTTAAVIRAVPPVVLITGWWVMRVRYTDPTNRIWLARALAFALVAALLATAQLPTVVRVIAVLGLLPLAAGPMMDGLLSGFPHLFFPTAQYLRHAAVAAGAGLYAVAVPYLSRRLPEPAAVPA